MSKLNNWISTTMLGLAFAAIAVAEQPTAHVVFPDIPGAAELEQGDIAEGIAALKKRLKTNRNSDKSAELAALCGGYILSGEFENAQQVCDEAVRAPSMKVYAYNNRGVLRLIQGEFFAAERDFKSAQAGGIRSVVDKAGRKAVSRIVSNNSDFNQTRLAATLESNAPVAEMTDSEQ